MSTWQTSANDAWTFSARQIFGHGGGIGEYQASYAVAASSGPMLNGRVAARIQLTDRCKTGAGLVSRADGHWTLAAFYTAPVSDQDDMTYAHISAYREGLLIPVATSAEPIRLEPGYNRFSLEFFSGQIRGEIQAGDRTYELMTTCPHVPFPGYVGLIKFYRATLLARDLEIEKTEVPFNKTVARTDEFDFDVFLCHSSKDLAVVQEITQAFTAAGITYWIDTEQVMFGDQIIPKIEDGLRRSRYVLPCVSTNLTSGWTRAEYSAILNSELSGDSTRVVIPVVLDNVAPQDIPPLLRDKKRVSYANKMEFSEFVQFVLRR